MSYREGSFLHLWNIAFDDIGDLLGINKNMIRQSVNNLLILTLNTAGSINKKKGLAFSLTSPSIYYAVIL